MTSRTDKIMALADEYANRCVDVFNGARPIDRSEYRAALRAEVQKLEDELAAVKMHDQATGIQWRAQYERAEKAEAALAEHFDLAPQRYAAAKAALPILERNMECPVCYTVFADGVLHDTGIALINTFDRMTKAEAALAQQKSLEPARQESLDEEGMRLLERHHEHSYNPFEPDNQSRLYNDTAAYLAKVK